MSLYESAPETKPIKIVPYPRHRPQPDRANDIVPPRQIPADPTYEELVINAFIDAALTLKHL
ncbi:hypothetical protein F1C15_15650 (plasmid) [Frigoribacterium sp. NBH87]|uniref:hypothetical protein n=1 Tax=Frigoribacterium sp. NBH87 TaxID=2596916 RepID=UPI00162469D2|nr:hypothetical protein [Frigoribacterium sp. NBH87]QNE45406.1 hypothetical protein F1C15_15650 [Frigoribacterium sp. NBH87]